MSIHTEHTNTPGRPRWLWRLVRRVRDFYAPRNDWQVTHSFADGLVFTTRTCAKTGAVEVQNNFGGWIPIDYAFRGTFGDWERELYKRAVPHDPNETKWCAMCGKWGNHTSGTCPDLAHLRTTPNVGGQPRPEL